MSKEEYSQLWLPLDEPSSTAILSVDDIYDRADEAMLTVLMEDRRIERKPGSFTGEPLSEYLSMWANTPAEGGIIVIGQNDDGSFGGCKKQATERLNKTEKAGDLCPDAKLESRRVTVNTHDFVLLMRVHYHKTRVVKTVKGKAFTRRGDSKVQLKDDEIRSLQIDKGEIDFEQDPCGIEYPGEFDTVAIDNFCNAVRSKLELQTDVSNSELLAIRHLGELNGDSLAPNIACALLFSKCPDKRIPGCKIRFFRFDGTTEGTGERFNAVKDIWLESGGVASLIHKAEAVLDSQIRTFAALGKDGKFYANPEYPKAAWYEAIVNAVVHRAYGNGMRNMPIFIKMFDDRLEIESPGGFLPFVTPENIYGAHHPRNPKLMQAMYFIGYVKMASEGTRRMRDTMQEASLPAPVFSQKEIDFSRVRVTLHNNISQRREWVDTDAVAVVGAVLAKTLPENQKRIINFVAEHGEINVTQTVRLTKMAWGTAKKNLDQLVSRGILTHVHRTDIERDPNAKYVLLQIDDAVDPG